MTETVLEMMNLPALFRANYMDNGNLELEKGRLRKWRPPRLSTLEVN